MRLYNTLTKAVEEIHPIAPPTVTVYTCGPTVYDYPHIGNWFTFIRYDLLIRALKSADFDPKWVMNITDVGHLVSDADEGEDKLEKGARREGKTAWEVAKYYSEYFEKALPRLNITQPDHMPKATDHITEQIDLIQRLEKKGFTYVIKDGVYFDTAKFPEYADFAKLNLADLQEGARVETNLDKHNPSDFALWKFSPEGVARDMEWDSPWGKGFPGWHLECSAMSMKYLGETIDIHCGGIDHIQVHHTNEVAQSEAATGKPFAKHWMHTNHISVDGEKISKSLGNSITLEDIEAQGFSLEVLRLLVAESHYSTHSKFSLEALKSAQNRLNNFTTISDYIFQPQEAAAALPDGYLKTASENLTKHFQDDLNTPKVLSDFNQVLAEVERNGLNSADASEFKALLETVDSMLGLKLSSRADITPEQKGIVARREQSRLSSDWELSDQLRQELLNQGISIKDNPYGQTWARL